MAKKKRNETELMLAFDDIKAMKAIYKKEFKHYPHFMILKKLKNEIGVSMSRWDNFTGMVDKMRFERRTNPWIIVEKAIKKSPDHPTMAYLNKVLGKRLSKKEIKDAVEYLLDDGRIVIHQGEIIYIYVPPEELERMKREGFEI